MQDLEIYRQWVCISACLFIAILFSIRCFYNLNYSSKVRKKVIIHLECLQKPNEAVILNSLTQYRKFDSNNYLKSKAIKDERSFQALLEVLNFNEKEIERLILIFNNIDRKFVSKSLVDFYRTKIMDSAYVLYKLLWSYRSPAGRNTYVNYSFYDKRALEKIMVEKKHNDNGFIPMNDFESNWITRRFGNEVVDGYQKKQICGCYIILVFDRPVTSYEKYQNVYIGQSTNVYRRVHNHFNGKGNGDVYADAKYGKYLYVKIIPCDASEMNRLEKELISCYNATNSYNKTSGGGMRRQ